MDFPTKPWEQMDEAEKEHFRGMSKDRILERWESSEGENIREKIIAINFEYGNSHSYESFVGTIKTGWGDEPPKIERALGRNCGYCSSHLGICHVGWSDQYFCHEVHTKRLTIGVKATA